MQRSMNVVVFSAYAINTPHFETELEIAHTHADAGDHVTILTCGAHLEACDPNPYHDPPRCAKCMGRRDAGLPFVPSSITIEPFYHLTDQDRRELDELPTRFDSRDELTRLHVGHFDIGYAALSSLISRVRDPEPDPAAHASLLRTFLRAAWTVHRSMSHYLDAHPVDRVYVFNGRLAPMRAVLRACQEKAVDCYTHERGADLARYILLRNTSIHYIDPVRRLIWETWHAASTDPDRERTARQWYEARARGEGGDDFVRGQRRQCLPADWDGNKRNITVFVSSEDEFASISDEWRNPLYESQNEGLRAIIESLRADPRDVHLYIRTHPNLALVDNVQTREIAQMEAPFVTVIPPADPVDTYELIRNSVSVVTFGSTTGIEAVYWGIPSILAGMTFYRDLGVTHNPSTHEELMRMMHADLEPRPIEPALAYGYFWPTFGVPFKYFAPDGFYSGRFKGVRIRPSLIAQARITLLRARYPQRAVRHVARLVTRRWRIARNKLRRRA
jgi:hypothetical protein